MSTERTSPRARVVVERVYRATLAEVWDLWTTKDGFEAWWGPQGFRADVHEIDARVGGTLYSDGLTAEKGDAPTYIDMVRHNIKALTSALDH